MSPTQAFIYDALYRLIEATGRELIGTATFGATDNWNDSAWQTTHKGDGNAVQNYTQKYTYDAVGNILELRHIAAAGAYTRTYDIATDNNRLLHTTVGRIPPDEDTYSYIHDVRGNITEMPHLDAMYWNLNNELHQIANGTMEAFYQYSGGQRVRKYVDKGSIKEERIYLGSFEIYRKFDNTSSLTTQRTTVHINDDTGRIAMLEVDHPVDENDYDVDPPLTRYIYSNHLQSASLELDEEGDIISYEEYHPYGTTSYQAMNAAVKAAAKRYRYTGKERDEESGLYYHGARYYIPWLARWTAVDPLENDYSPQSPYNYGNSNPIIFYDPNGMCCNKTTHTVTRGESLSGIAKQHGTTVDQLLKNNPQIKNKNEIFPGQAINLNTQQVYNFKIQPIVMDLDKLKVENNSQYIKINPSDITFTEKPNKVNFGMDYYKNRADDFKSRTNLTPPKYYLGYGDKYINRFKNNTRSKLSEQGQAWLDEALINLQKAIESKLVDGKYMAEIHMELNETKFMDYVFDSHVGAYVDAGLLELSIMDKLEILLTPDAKDLFSDRGLKQASEIAKLQIEYYMKNPNIANQHINEIKSNASKINAKIEGYYLKNKSFFNDYLGANPQQITPGDEHKVIETLKLFLYPNYIF